MLRILPILFLLLVINTGFAETNIQAQPLNEKVACQTLTLQDASKEELAKSGCCSWHQGVCGCSEGRQVCCDGTFSPSCTCNKEEPVEIIN